MNKLFYNHNQCLEIPANWTELDRWQLSSLLEHVHTAGERHYHRLASLLILAATRDNVRHKAIIAGLSEENRFDVARFMTWWVYETPIKITDNLFAKFKGYYGPGKDFRYVYFEEFIKAEKYYTAYAASRQTADLDGLVSCLYRPKRWPFDRSNPLNRDDCRVLFSEKLRETMVQKVASWPLGMKLSVFYYFDSCLQLLQQTFPWAFEPGGQSSPKIKNESPKTLYHVARELAKGIELEKVLMRPVVPVFFELNEARVDAEKMKIELAKQSKSKK